MALKSRANPAKATRKSGRCCFFAWPASWKKTASTSSRGMSSRRASVMKMTRVRPVKPTTIALSMRPPVFHTMISP